jgi:Leucine-rich repeat (LRR) protein
LAVDSLDELLLDRTLLNDAGLAAVGNLSRVVELDISECALISSRGIANLEHTNIADLNISWCKLDDSVIPILSSMVGLQSLNLSGNPIRGDGFEKWTREMRLVDLDLSYTAIADSQLKHLSQLDSLEYLTLDGTTVTLEGVEAIASLPNLKYLSIGNTKVNDDAVEVLSKLPSLTSLVIGNGQFSEKALEQLEKSRPELRIHDQHEFERKAKSLQLEDRTEVD